MIITIVYVHGSGNQVREALLKQQWDEALFGRDLGASSRMAYWASVPVPAAVAGPVVGGGGVRRDRRGAEIEEAPTSLLEAAPPPPVEPPEEFVAQSIREVQAAEAAITLESVPESAGKDLEEWLRRMTYTADALAAGENAEPPPASPFEALPLPRPIRIAAFRELVKRTFKDVYAYFFGDSKEPMRQVLRDALGGIDGPVVVLSHSLGTIIAYDVLREQGSSGLEIPLFVTVGSPLGVTEVQDLVERPLQVPAAVTAWRNASDARDLVALDHTLRPAYAPAERCTDFVVVNDSSNHHGIREYLRAAPIQEPIRELFQQ
jgi:hypothetical protein